MALPAEESFQPIPDPSAPSPVASNVASTDWASYLRALRRSTELSLTSPTVAFAVVACAGLVLEWILVRKWVGALSLIKHPGFPESNLDMLEFSFGSGPRAINGFIGLLILTFAPYLLALRLASSLRGNAAIVMAFFGAVLLGATMLLILPVGAIDIMHNVLDGRMVWLYHLNPMFLPPAAIATDPLYPSLHYWQTTVSPYGPLWFLMTGPAVWLGGNGLVSNLLAFKALPFAFELVALGCIAAIAHRIDPRHTAAAIVCFGWNPMVLWEFAGNGHNDSLMIAFMMLSLLLLLTKYWPAAFAALACSVLVKYVSILLAPLFVIWLLRRYGRAALWPMAGGLLAAAALSIALISPFWSGPATFAQIQQQRSGVIFSVASAISTTWGEDTANSSQFRPLRNRLTAGFLILYAIVALRTKGDSYSLVRSSSEAMFLFLVLMVWWFWPWYVLWGLALASAITGTAQARLFVIFSCTAMLLYVASVWRLEIFNYTNMYPMAIGTALFVFTAPVLYAIMNIEFGDRPSLDHPA